MFAERVQEIKKPEAKRNTRAANLTLSHEFVTSR